MIVKWLNGMACPIHVQILLSRNHDRQIFSSSEKYRIEGWLIRLKIVEMQCLSGSDETVDRQENFGVPSFV